MNFDTTTTERLAPNGTTRRRFLRTAAAVGALAGVGGLAGAQSEPETFSFGGEVGGWIGRSPDSVADETNPPLRLEAGTTYVFEWENTDGQPHNVAFLDDDDNSIERSEIVSEQGATQSYEFTATEEMAAYICDVHPVSMRGEILFGDETATPENTNAEPYVPKGASVRLETVADGGLVAPLDFETPPGGSAMYIVDRFGQVYRRDSDGLRDEPFIDVSDRIVEITGEMGLLGMAFHPDYEENRKFYLRYSAPIREGTPEEFDHTEVLAEFTANDDGTSADPDSERTVMEIPSPYDTHNSGAIVFGPEDGYLYMGMGDGGGAHDTDLGHVSDWYEANEGGNGQNVSENLLGGIHRIDVDSQDGEKAYGIPDDNPLVEGAGLDEYYAWGLRNPWRMGFSGGDLYASDVGQNMFEEIDLIEKGTNYGWNVREGTHCFSPGPEGSRNPPESCPTHTPEDVRGGEPLVDPIIEYPHTHEGVGVGSASIGGYIYENDAIPALQGKYVFGDFRKTKETETPTGSLFAATPAEGDGLWELEDLQIENTENGYVGGYVLALGRDDDGELYVLTTDNTGGDETGRVRRILPPENQEATTAGNATTATGNATNASAGTAGNATVATNGSSTASGTAGTGTSATATGTGAGTETGATATGTAGTTGGTTAGSEGGSAGTGGSAGGTGNGSSEGTTEGSGPGFGVLAAAGAVAVGAARALLGRDD